MLCLFIEIYWRVDEVGHFKAGKRANTTAHQRNILGIQKSVEIQFLDLKQ
jgi:hypothetical protein